jgi:hypothetical protein
MPHESSTWRHVRPREWLMSHEPGGYRAAGVVAVVAVGRGRILEKSEACNNHRSSGHKSEASLPRGFGPEWIWDTKNS